jgi:hypothetical protein
MNNPRDSHLDSEHLVSFRNRDLDRQVELLQKRLQSGSLSPLQVEFAAKIGDLACQHVLSQPKTGVNLDEIVAAISAEDAIEEKARAYIAVARITLNKWYQEQDQLLCDATNSELFYEPENARITFSPAIGVNTKLRRTYYKDYSIHYVLRSSTGESYGISDWGELANGNDWIQLAARVGPIDCETLSQVSIRKATWISNKGDMSITTDTKGWITCNWYHEGCNVGSISTKKGDKTLNLSSLPGKDTPTKVFWAAQKCVLCPCSLHGAVCVCLDSFASSWRSRWGGIATAGLIAAQLVPKSERLIERQPPLHVSLILSGKPLTSDDLCAVSTELSLWALGLADPVADDVYQIEALNNEQGSA